MIIFREVIMLNAIGKPQY